MSLEHVQGLSLPSDCASKYDPLALLGSGGFGVVLLCLHRDLGRHTAIKVLHTLAGGDLDVVARFIDEARITSRLRHPNIVQLLDYGGPPSTPWLAYEYIEGQTVDHRLKQGPIPWREAVQVAIEIANALDAAHKQGITHRDIKPENVLRTAEGLHKVIDFGIAKWSSGGGARTAEGLVLGTPAYMSPEQIRGRPASPRYDLYALGVMIHQMVAGRLPFVSSNPHDLLKMHLTVFPPPLDRECEDIPPRLARIVQRLLEKDGRQSFASARELLDSLEPILDPGLIDGFQAMDPDVESSPPNARMPTAVSGVESPEGPGLPPGSSRLFRSGAIAALTVVLMVFGISWLQQPRTPRSPPLPHGPSPSSLPGPDPGSRRGVRPPQEVSEDLARIWSSFARHPRDPYDWPLRIWSDFNVQIPRSSSLLLEVAESLEGSQGPLPAHEWWNLRRTLWTLTDWILDVGILEPGRLRIEKVKRIKGSATRYERMSDDLRGNWRKAVASLGNGRLGPGGRILQQALEAHDLHKDSSTLRGKTAVHEEIARALVAMAQNPSVDSGTDACFSRANRFSILIDAVSHWRSSNLRVPGMSLAGESQRDQLERTVMEEFAALPAECAGKSAPWSEELLAAMFNLLDRRITDWGASALPGNSLAQLEDLRTRYSEIDLSPSSSQLAEMDRRIAKLRKQDTPHETWPAEH